MKVLITGAAGFVGSRIALALRERLSGIEITGFDNLLRPGSELNRSHLSANGVRFVHGDLRVRSDIEVLGKADWVIDAAANPSVLAGVDGKSSPRQLGEHNLAGTLNILEYCREHGSGLLLLSSSRVYSVRDLSAVKLQTEGKRFILDPQASQPDGVVETGLDETFSVHPPVSLYGATKLASEIMALEYGYTFQFPVWIDRCGVLAGAGQFGTAEQGIFSYWLHAHAARRPLRYIGFGGTGLQVRDAFHPDDLTELLIAQMNANPPENPVFNAGGGLVNSMSLAELTEWCDGRFGRHAPVADSRERPFDIPWVVMDHSRVTKELHWTPQKSLSSILDEIADHVRSNPDWLTRVAAQ